MMIQKNNLSGVLHGWRSIDSAPKDGTPIFAVVYGFQPTVAEFNEHIGWVYYDESRINDEYLPTHWMPLPRWDTFAIDSDMLNAKQYQCEISPGMIEDEL